MKITNEEQLIKVRITYRMAKGLWETAENCITTVIEKQHLEDIVGEQKRMGWGVDLGCGAGILVTEILERLVELQGYSTVEDWSIEAIEEKQTESPALTGE